MKTIVEMAKIWEISPRQIRYLIKTNKIKGVKLIGKTYFIPDNAKLPEVNTEKTVEIDSTDLIFVVTKDENNLVYRSILYNFQEDQQNFCVFTNTITKEDSPYYKLSSLKKMTKQYTPSLVIFVECDSKNWEDESNTLYINKSFHKKPDITQIYNYVLQDEKELTTHGLQLYFKEGICNKIYNIILSILSNENKVAVAYNLLEKEYAPTLKLKLPTIQASYSLLCRRLDEAKSDFHIMNVSVWNEIEYTDSNNEINYYVHILNALERGVKIDFIFINNSKTIGFMKNSFAIKAIIEHLSNKAKIYLVDKTVLNKELLDTLGQGFCVYGKESIYYDDITPYSLGSISADKEDIAKYTECANQLKKNATIIASKKEWIDKYGI